MKFTSLKAGRSRRHVPFYPRKESESIIPINLGRAGRWGNLTNPLVNDTAAFTCCIASEMSNAKKGVKYHFPQWSVATSIVSQLHPLPCHDPWGSI